MLNLFDFKLRRLLCICIVCSSYAFILNSLYSLLPEILCHIYLFIFPGIVTTLYIKFTFDGLRYKLRSISCGALSSYTMALEKRKTALLNHRYLKGTWRRPLSLVQGPYTWEQNQWIVLYQKFLLLRLYVKFYKFLSKDIE